MSDYKAACRRRSQKKRTRFNILLPVALVLVALIVGVIVMRGQGSDEPSAYTPAQTVESAVPVFGEAMAMPVQTMESPTEEPEAAPAIGDDWLDDAIFVGDSITGALFNYNLVYGGLGKATVVFSNGFACHNAEENGYSLAFKGRMVGIGEAVSEAGAGKVFILFAMNDVGQPIDELKECWIGLIEHIRSYSQADIYIQSGTPIFTETGYFSNENMSQLNAMLRELCDEQNCVYVDIASGLSDENGMMRKEFSLDYVHFNNDGCKRWIEALYDPKSYILPNEQGGEK